MNPPADFERPDSIESPFCNPDFIKRYISLREESGSPNLLLDEQASYGLAPQLQGLSVLDLGCGWGNFSRYTVARGAKHVIGLDNSSGMLEIAKSYGSNDRIEYLLADIETYEFPKHSFDFVFSGLTLHYISDLPRLFKNVQKTLLPGGAFVFSVEHPIKTARDNAWVLGDEGSKIAWTLRDYAFEGPRVATWLGCNVLKFHRKTETYVRHLLDAHFTVTALKEPQPTAENIADHPNLYYEAIRPPFLAMAARA
ncbi:MAG TPA: class I SAM-dependent methyltransferase [Bradyrhizobium sp.]|nr:class I SAM-dependent methyltransferase [Bradyrhizobium sp.]